MKERIKEVQKGEEIGRVQQLYLERYPSIFGNSIHGKGGRTWGREGNETPQDQKTRLHRLICQKKDSSSSGGRERQKNHLRFHC